MKVLGMQERCCVDKFSLTPATAALILSQLGRYTSGRERMAQQTVPFSVITDKMSADEGRSDDGRPLPPDDQVFPQVLV